MWNENWIHTLGGGKKEAGMRGDNKWPPEEVKRQSEVDNEQRRQLALGPVFRPRRVNKVILFFQKKNSAVLCVFFHWLTFQLSSIPLRFCET